MNPIKRLATRTIVSISIVAFTSFGNNSANATPIVADPTRFKVELFADFSAIDPDLDAFQLTMTSGENGFGPGLYVTPSPSRQPGGDRLIRVTAKHQFEIVNTNELLQSGETMVFARGSYGKGILVTEPRDLRIRRLLPDGSLSNFAENVSTTPFGPTVLAYGPNDLLYATDGSTGNDTQGSRDILQINPDGTSSVFATIPDTLFPDPAPTTIVQRHDTFAFASIDANGRWQEGGGFVSGTFTINFPDESDLDVLFLIPIENGVAQESDIRILADGLRGLELVELGPGGAFGSNLFVAMEGAQRVAADGELSILSPDGTLTPFLTNIDAIDVAFDTDGVLGGGMFISDGTNRAGPGKIWHVTEVAEPSTIGLLALGTLLFLRSSQSNRRKIFQSRKMYSWCIYSKGCRRRIFKRCLSSV